MYEGELADIEWYFEEIKLVPEEHDCFMYLYSRLSLFQLHQD